MMTREEATDILKESKRQNEIMRDNPRTFWTSHQMADGVKNAERRIAALDMAITALRPVSREQVKKVWRGCEYCSGDCPPLDWQFGLDHILPNYKYCPVCGAPITDEAVQMVMERLEALHGE